MSVAVVLAFLMLLGRLFQLQVLEGDHFARRAERNFIETIEVEAPRGRIFDARGRPLAVNRPAYTLYVTARPRVFEIEDPRDPTAARESARQRVSRLIERLQTLDATTAHHAGSLARDLGVLLMGRTRGRRLPRPGREPITDAQIKELADLIDFVDDEDRLKFEERLRTLRESEADGRYAVPVRSNLSNEEFARIETREQLRGWVETRTRARRYYAEGALVAFVTGYMREISVAELEDTEAGEYKAGDRIGKMGLERQWESYLRGRAGQTSRVVNAVGVPVKNPPPAATAALPPTQEPIPGQDIYLSLDVDLQRVAEEAFEGKRAGGVVVMEVETGRILAMLSTPSIDPNVWEHPIAAEQYQEWLSSPFKPFIDKTVQENYFPGSTYKVVSALAMLEEVGYDPDELVDCGRYVEYGGRKFRDTHACGEVSLESAIIQSCNVYFYRMAMERGLTLAKMETIARRFGLGERTGLGLNNEARGVVPTEAMEIRQGTFQQGVRLNSAIGQGNVKTTVLQIAALYAAIANGGWLMTPSLVDRIETHDGRVVFENAPRRRNTEPVLEALDRERIHRGLVGVVNNATGTAYDERLEGILVAGKTGTAQVGRTRANDDEAPIIEGWDTTQDHAWFAAYAPAQRPKIVAVAIVVHGGVGADAAAPIVMRLIEHYLGTSGEDAADAERRPAGVPPPLPGGKEAATSARPATGRDAPPKGGA